MRILLDENMPESVGARLRFLGHEVDSINSLRLKGLDNSRLYRELARNYDICFTRDARFARTVQSSRAAVSAKVLRVVLPQQRRKAFADTFIKAFEKTDWSAYANGADWP